MARPFSRLFAALLALLLVPALAGATRPRPTIVVLQLNLCNSGISGCFTNRAVPQAAELIRAYAPDVVTLNEVCRADVVALANVYPAGTVVPAFQSAPDRRTGGGTECLNGQQFGIGVIVRAGNESTIDGGIYPVQDVTDPEIRAWLCVSAAVVACTAHLASTSRTVAVEQCRELFAGIVPRQRGDTTAIVAGDLNLRDPDVRSCVPRDYVRTSDGDVQYVLATDATAVLTRQVFDMRGTTDHPALLVVLTIPAFSAEPPSMSP